MKRMYDDMDPWLRERIDEDLAAMTKEQEALLRESEEFQGVEMPMERLQDIHREIDARRARRLRRPRIRRRVILAVAAAAIVSVGMGIVGSGTKLYRPEIKETELGDGVSTQVDNTETKESEYEEEEVCQEIVEKLGVVPIRFSYRPDGIYLSKYSIKEDEKSVVMNYQMGDDHLYIFISKDYKDSSINSRIEGRI